jgi:tRNA pseudouridine55 synthase
LDGVLVIDKPAGITSHDAVAMVKRTLGARKVGHLGTLDPAATGVLPLVLDSATAYARFLSGGRKEYMATMTLGVETDTLDADGSVTATMDATGVTETAVREALESFVGSIKQLPPMYSAVKKGGTPLYKLARKGVVVEREPKDVIVHEIEVTGVSMPEVAFRVVCSGGTYIRTLCHDAGTKLGCGAHLKRLRRTANGAFTEAESVPATASKAELEGRVIPLSAALGRALRAIEIDPATEARILAGTTLVGIDNFPSLSDKEMVRLVIKSRSVAIASHRGEGLFRIEKPMSGAVRREGNGFAKRQRKGNKAQEVKGKC